ncbi:hypothetical protein [Paenibacillus aceris]|uniref:Uncharacterized protein n=1 Tax=Paenibacillus aceris TaxID=869555 RepID=A0ABS4HWF4_9BACL|nr:hypothetical protein [Paenibacillus aceris]MBP1962958.1 hypothetical protein [Paenibacillus aceris]NHW38384.1 hypothetical protein [Paenibacillus aceris]
MRNMHLGKPHNASGDRVLQKAADSPKTEESPSFSTFSPTTIAHLQRSIGNRAVANLVTRTEPGVIQRVKKENLTLTNNNIFGSMVSWVNARPNLAKVLDMEKALLHAPSFDIFRTFLIKIKTDTTDPLPSFNDSVYYAKAVKDYFDQNPVPIEDGKKSLSELVSGGATSSPPEAKEEKKAVVYTPVNRKDQIWLGPSAKKHYDHMKGTTALPRSNSTLLAYVKDNASYFIEVDGHWTLQLGEFQTKQKGGGTELKPWSILIDSSDWKVFHYGPTGEETD